MKERFLEYYIEILTDKLHKGMCCQTNTGHENQLVIIQELINTSIQIKNIEFIIT